MNEQNREDFWLLPVKAELVRLTGGMRLERERPDRHLIVIVTAGEALIKLNGSPVHLNSFKIYGVPPRQYLEVHCAADMKEHLKLLFLEFAVHRPGIAGDGGPSAGGLDMLRTIGEFAGTADERTLALGCQLAEQWNAGDELERISLHALFLEVLAWIASHARQHSRDQTGDMLEMVRKQMQENYFENLTIGQLANMAGSSETHFRERFRSRYGIGPLEYLTSVRLGAARRLLLVSGRSVREVAHRVGYRDEFYFSRLFRKHTGVTPSQYARNKERHIVALGYPAVGQLLALGIMPGSAALNSRWSGYYRSYYHLDIPVLQTDAFNDDDGDLIKEIGRISPDVIIGGDFQSHSVQEKLGRIAPSLFTPWSRTDWREQLMTTAVFLERTEEAEQFLSGYDRKAADARGPLHGIVGRDSVMVVCIAQNRILVYGQRNIGAVLYGDLGLRPARNIGEIEGVEETSAERLAEFEADRILLMVWEDEASSIFWQKLRVSDHWRHLKAVREGHIFLIRPFPWLEYTAFAHNRIVDEVLQLFAAKRPSV